MLVVLLCRSFCLIQTLNPIERTLRYCIGSLGLYKLLSVRLRIYKRDRFSFFNQIAFF